VDVLQTRGLVKTFGGLRAVDEVGLTVAAAHITGLLGPNGSGKTTLFNLIDGTVSATAGEVVLAGRPIGRRGRPARAHAGLARTYQLPRLFPSLTVVENLAAAQPRFSFRRLWLPRVTAAERARALEVLGGLGLAATPTATRPNSATGSASSSSWPGCCGSIRSCSCWTSPPPGSARC
jgi:ABC-type branched-subunit amino acid transport system ATPase component